ncbi:M15 family metallopeptidase [Synechococcus elongatus IITB4]|uniref:M15 family metallopeptidase n=1 Tax=Synechococcus elongatus TaxID=32046 RepID=UPI0030CE916E
MLKRFWLTILCVLCFCGWIISHSWANTPVDLSSKPISEVATWQRFLVDIKTLIPDVNLDIRYYRDYNFVGRKIDGYQAPKCLLTPAATQALAAVQADLAPQGYALKIYDCYRPQQAVDLFVLWAEDLDDRQMQQQFYPQVNKADLFQDGYIAAKSGHSRGSTVDVTLVPLKSKTIPCTRSHPCQDNSLDMGTAFDYFDPLSHTLNSQISPEQQRNRLRLKTAMERQGFRNLPGEWWHYTLQNEPYPETYFNFPVQ